MDQREMQEKVILYQMLKGQLDQFNQQTVFLERKAMELEATKDIVNSMKNMKEPKDMLLPLGGDLFAHGKLSNPKKVLVNMGAGVIVSNDINAGVELVDQKIAEVEQLREGLQRDSTKIVEKLAEIESELQQAQK